MPRPKRVNCRQCGGHIDQVGHLSKRGLCARCGELNAIRQNLDLARKGGLHLNVPDDPET